jgi:hypothetical protein
MTTIFLGIVIGFLGSLPREPFLALNKFEAIQCSNVVGSVAQRTDHQCTEQAPPQKGFKEHPDSFIDKDEELKIEMTLKGFDVHEAWYQADISLNVVFKFRLGRDFHPMNINLLSGDKYVDENKAKASLATWTFSGLAPNYEYSLVLTWINRWGYTSIKIISDQTEILIKRIGWSQVK